MVKVRQNGKGFGHCTQVGKALRMALRPCTGAYLTFLQQGRLPVLPTEEPGPGASRGERTVGQGLQTQEGNGFQGFGFTPDCLPDQVLPFPQVYDATAKRSPEGVDPKRFAFGRGYPCPAAAVAAGCGLRHAAHGGGGRVPCTLQPQTPGRCGAFAWDIHGVYSRDGLPGGAVLCGVSRRAFALEGKQAVGFGAVWV